MKRQIFAAGMVSVVVFGISWGSAMGGPEDGHAEHEHAKSDFASAMPMCPVMEEPISFFSRTDTDDGPVYFCCESCIEKYTANPKKYARKVSLQRKALSKLAKVQVTCPVSSEPVDGKIFAELDGEKVYFCCKGCASKYQADPAKYKAALAGSYSYQTKCPVAGETIDPTSFAKLPTGETVYYCCNGCDSKLMGNPSEYNKNLLAQGINIDWEKVRSLKAGKGNSDSHEGHDH